MFDSKSQPWYLQLLFFVFLTAVSYVLAVVIYIVCFRTVALMPNNELIDDSVRASFLYILLMIVIITCMLPMFNREWDATLRRFGLLVAIFVTIFSAGEKLGFLSLDPQGSLTTVIHSITNPITKHISAANR